jgi:hypothetical protein
MDLGRAIALRGSLDGTTSESANNLAPSDLVVQMADVHPGNLPLRAEGDKRAMLPAVQFACEFVVREVLEGGGKS